MPATKKSSVTTWGGVVAALGGLVVAIGEALGKPAVAAIGAGITSLGVLVLGTAARDNGVTSEQAGAVKPEAPK